MNKYTIELSEKQLNLLMVTLDRSSRTIVGQLRKGISDYAEDAYERHFGEDMLWEEGMDKINQKLNELKKLCWDQDPNTHYGVGYSHESDILIDMVEVIRHKLYVDRGGEPNSIVVSSYPPYHWNKDVDLIKIRKE